MNVIYTVRIIANIRNLFYSAHIFIGNGGFIQLWNSQSELQTIIYDFTVNNQFTMFLCFLAEAGIQTIVTALSGFRIMLVSPVQFFFMYFGIPDRTSP